MLLNLSKKTWTEGLLLDNFANHAASNEKVRLCAGGLQLDTGRDAAAFCSNCRAQQGHVHSNMSKIVLSLRMLTWCIPCYQAQPSSACMHSVAVMFISLEVLFTLHAPHTVLFPACWPLTLGVLLTRAAYTPPPHTHFPPRWWVR
jgi:hypothetical protein